MLLQISFSAAGAIQTCSSKAPLLLRVPLLSLRLQFFCRTGLDEEPSFELDASISSRSATIARAAIHRSPASTHSITFSLTQTLVSSWFCRFFFSFESIRLLVAKYARFELCVRWHDFTLTYTLIDSFGLGISLCSHKVLIAWRKSCSSLPFLSLSLSVLDFYALLFSKTLVASVTRRIALYDFFVFTEFWFSSEG